MKRILFPLAVMFLAFFSACSKGPVGADKASRDVYADEENGTIGRGTVSFLNTRGQAVLSWRLLPGDPAGVIFNLYRKEIGEGDDRYRWIARTDRTSYTDLDAHGKRYSYAVRTGEQGNNVKEQGESISLSSIGGKAALVFDTGQPYKYVRVVSGDLNGDGEPEIVIAYSGYQNVDPYEKAWSRSEESIKVAAFLPAGNRLWTVDLGSGIETGIMYQPMVVWDLDGDGRAEVILKTNKSADPLDYEGERITVLDGMSGKVKQEAKWPALLKGGWSDYNNDSRNFLAVAHLDGKDPYVIAARGTYKMQRIWAFDKNLHRVWERNLGMDFYYPSGIRERLIKFWNINDKMKYIRARLTGKARADIHRGTHSLPVADIDDDGKEEIFWGERCIDGKGKDLWVMEEKIPYPGHPDIVFPADILPSRKGKETYFAREGGAGKNDRIGMYLVDHQGKIIWEHWGYHHIDSGWVGKIAAGQEGMQCLAVDIVDKEEAKEGPWKLIDPSAFLWRSDGTLLGNPPSSWYDSIPLDWDGDNIREIVITTKGEIWKYGGTIMEDLSTNCLWGADLFGDQREEIVAAPGGGKIYVFFNTTVPESPPRVTPRADRRYRNDLSRTAMQVPPIPTEGGRIPGKREK